METKSPLTPLLTAIAPITWGSTYFVTSEFLPPDRPIFAAAARALPIGLVIVAARRRLPRGSWWWRSALLGTLNIGLFFALLFLAAYRLPGGFASTLTALSPLAVMVIAFAFLRETPTRLAVGGALIGVVGIALLVVRADFVVDPIGVAAAVGAVVSSAFGFVLVKKWTPPTDLVTLTGWQLVAGGLLLAPLTLVVEGAPPTLDGRALLGFAYLGILGTGLAYVLWFRGLTRMPAGSAALIGLVGPVVGTLLGVAFADETFGPAQLIGVCMVAVGILAGQPAVVNLYRRRRRVLDAPKETMTAS